MIQNTRERPPAGTPARARARARARAYACLGGGVDLRTLVAPHYKTQLTRLMGRCLIFHMISTELVGTARWHFSTIAAGIAAGIAPVLGQLRLQQLVRHDLR
jgi:hypothetical protein